jgi:rod shape determining protein RodA
MKGLGLELPRATVGVSRWRRFRAALDWPLILTIVALCAIGILNLYSASRGVRFQAKFDRQLEWMLLGVVGFIIVTTIDYRTFVRLSWLGFAFTIMLLVLARWAGSGSYDPHGVTYRWIKVGIDIQPSELATVMTILVLARIFRDAEPGRYTPRALALRFAVLVVPIVLVAIQPDLGTAVLLSLVILTVGYLAMPSVWPVVYVTAGGLVAIPFLWEKLHPYQKDRILGFIDCGSAPTHASALDAGALNTCWHTQQSVFAVGSGKILGKGFLDGTQNQFGYVPENLTDFPFARLAEEWGFLGSVTLLAIFAFLLLWIVNVALSARDRMGAVICVGVAAMTFWHVAVNVAMVLGLAPVVGVTLPFVSYGGSSLVTFFVAMGLVANVSLRKHGY